MGQDLLVISPMRRNAQKVMNIGLKNNLVKRKDLKETVNSEELLEV